MSWADFFLQQFVTGAAWILAFITVSFTLLTLWVVALKTLCWWLERGE